MTVVAGTASAPGPAREPAREVLRAVAQPVLKDLLQHPFWDGVRSGTLPPKCLWYYAGQDAHHLVPSYARALARCAADAPDHAEAALLGSAAAATFGSLPRLDSEINRLATDLGRTGAPVVSRAGPAVQGYASFLLAAPLAGFSAALGGLLPMTWFHLWVSQDLRRTFDPRSRYAEWIDRYCAYDGYEDYVAQFLNLVDAEAARCSNREYDDLVESFSTAASYELAFADAAWRRQGWSS